MNGSSRIAPAEGDLISDNLEPSLPASGAGFVGMHCNSPKPRTPLIRGNILEKKMEQTKMGKAYTFPIVVSTLKPVETRTYEETWPKVNWDHTSITWLSRFDSISTGHRWEDETAKGYPIEIGSVNIQTDAEDMEEEALKDFVLKVSEATGSDVCGYLATTNDVPDYKEELEDHRFLQLLIPLNRSVSDPDEYRALVAWIRHKAFTAGLGEIGDDYCDRQKDPSSVAITSLQGPLNVDSVLKEVPALKKKL